MRYTKISKYVYFQYKLLLGALTTNVKRHAWDRRITNLCSQCSCEKETVVHMLVTCEKIKPLWHNLKRLCEYYLKINLELDEQTIVLNNYKSEQKQIVNQMIIIMKYYIYASKCMEKEVNFQLFMTRLSDFYLTEKYEAKAHQIKKLNKKWKNIL